MTTSTELGRQTFRSCEDLFLAVPTSCDLDGQCDPSITVPIVPEDLIDLEPHLVGQEGEASLEIYPEGNSFTVELHRADEGIVSLILLNDGRFVASGLPGKDSPANQEWLESDVEDSEDIQDNEDEDDEYTDLSAEMATALSTLAGRLAIKALQA